MATRKTVKKAASRPRAKPAMPMDMESERMDYQTKDMARELCLQHPRVQAIQARIERDLRKVAAKHGKKPAKGM